MLGTPSPGAPWGFLTLTSQMLMPPSIPVVQNWEHLSFPPVSTEIWLWVQKGSGNQSQVPPEPSEPLELPSSHGWEWDWTPSSPPPMSRKALGIPRDA